MNKSLVLFFFMTLALVPLVHSDDAVIKNSLSRLSIHSADIQSSPVAGLKTVLIESGVLCVSDDGRHLIQGPLYDVGSDYLINVTNQLLGKRSDALQKEMIIFKASQEKHVVTVFTDITCDYYHKLHEQIKDYNALGITIRYLAFPRQGLNSQTERDMASIWYSANRKDSFTQEMNSGNVQPATCDIDIRKYYTVGVQYGIQGTPALLLDNATLILGYQSPKEMASILDQQGSGQATGG
ncbi:protein-disulfide isomerase [Sodalis-like endosymbiont of Proechinophthirus fluctus]|uniref:bifunctional protein-disulfide isomerase/oxidoreductase DsbC n=1 Tax=Sodalis-like endosymbiont of Proechinophthirus fluctus TaxID=1462730 RepID=UPI0007A7D8FD|nr:bifunctional protein-disulfide isomerase/oxidoreductase DsbC [Sodalis-like endosymbiont of Proechinophthirus fluctus]KYP97136.1 protein-disulfide isomerase [Sodalis-like endosymbiont of Proechinophthirus fluctus]